jgi:hypothetical protein
MRGFVVGQLTACIRKTTEKQEDARLRRAREPRKPDRLFVVDGIKNHTELDAAPGNRGNGPHHTHTSPFRISDAELTCVFGISIPDSR